MKSIGLTIMLYILANLAYGQGITTLLNKPERGKTVNYKLDNLPDEILLDQSGKNNVWYFVNLQAPVIHSYQYLSTESGKYQHLFEEANMLVKDPWGGERYFRQIMDMSLLIGEVQSLEKDNDPLLIKKYDEPIISWMDPLSYGKSRDQTGHWYCEFDDWQLENIGVIEKKRLRVEVKERIDEIHDADGLLYLPRTSHEVYRVFRQRSSEQFWFEWKDDQWLSIDDGQLSSVLGIPKISSEYLFVDKENHEVIVQVILTDNEEIESVLFKSDGMMGQEKTFNPADDAYFVLYPTTSDGNIRLDFMGFSPGLYRIEILNIVGAMIWSDQMKVEGNKTVKLDLTFLPKGTYIYSIIDQEENRLYTRRLAIINP